MKSKTTQILCTFILTASIVLPAMAGLPSKACKLQHTFDLQGHRGARGLYPENTIPGFLHALDLGVTTLEMDVVINAQGSVVLSHEPWMSATICSHADGRTVTKKESKALNIYQMNDEQVKNFDCGSRGHSVYPAQHTLKVSKPFLHEVFEAVLLRSAETEREPVLFNIEIKSRPEHDGVFHPHVEGYVRALYDVVQQYDLVSRTSIQSFDPRALEAAHDIDPGLLLVLLVDNKMGFYKNLERLSFSPESYSPSYKYVNGKMIKAARAKNIRVIPWTVNDEKSMKKLVNLGVDGLITDYPDLAFDVLCNIEHHQ